MARTATKKKSSSKKKLTLAESRALLRKLGQEDLDCRENHWWVEVGYYYDDYGDVRRLWQCARCLSHKRNRMDDEGNYTGRTTYDYKPEYRIGRIPRSEIRAERLRRAKVYASENSMLARATFNGNGSPKPVKTAQYKVRHQQKTKVSK